MASFESAAEDLVRRIQNLDGLFDEAHQRLPELKQQVEAVDQQFDASWIELAKETAEFLEKVNEEGARLAQEAQEALQSVGQAQAAIQSGQNAADAVLDAAQAAAVDFGDGVRQLEDPVERLASDVGEASFQALSQQAGEVETNLEQALNEARDFLRDDVSSGLEKVQQDMADRFDEIRTTLAEECGNRLQAAFDDWSAKLTEVVDLIQADGFAKAQENAREVVDYALTECAKNHQQEFDKLIEVVHAVEDVLRDLHDGVGECETDIGEEGRNALDGKSNDTNEALNGMITALDAVKQLLASYTFVEM